MTAFNIIAGVVTLASAVFSLWIYLEGRKSRAVEEERLASLGARLRDSARVAAAIHTQGALIGTMADRDETTKKELKHLAVALLATVESLAAHLIEEAEQGRAWRFGVPSRYVTLDRPETGLKVESIAPDRTSEPRSVQADTTLEPTAPK